MENIHIKKVYPQDIYRLQQIGRQTFLETFSSVNTEENMKTYLEESFSMIKLKAELEDNNSEFYFAELNNNTIGYLKLNWGKSQTEIQDENTLEIERIYVLKVVYGKNIGQLLFQKAMDIAVQKKVNYVWLGVWEENLRAINFYKKNGFSEFNKHIFRLGNDEQTDIMMKLEMKAG
jgi:ribosomal protein S18 acetylase RimI-like enzyme